MRYLIGFFFGILLASASAGNMSFEPWVAQAWYHTDHPETPEEAKLSHAFACGYAYGLNRDHRDCPELEALEKAYGFK